MRFLDKVRDLFTDEEEIIETEEEELEKDELIEEEHQLPTFMRNKIEEENKRDEFRKQNITLTKEHNGDKAAANEILKTRSGNSNFSFPINLDEEEINGIDDLSYSKKEHVQEPRKQEFFTQKPVRQQEKSVAELYAKKEVAKPKKFKPTPVISPVYGILDKNYTKEDVKVTDSNSYEIQRPSRKVDFETVRNKAFGGITDEMREKLCGSCELYQEVKITKAEEIKPKEETKDSLVSSKDISFGDAEDNYYDFGVDYEIPKRSKKEEIIDDVKIVNHNEEESVAEKIEVKDEIKEDISVNTEDNADMILEGLTDVKDSTNENDIFNLIDSMYEGEEK